jgi:nicotinate-nucleotide pyrophosphorylase (carboxylating)
MSGYFENQNFADLLPITFADDVRSWLKADCPTTDIGGFVVGSEHKTATLYLKSTGVVCGIPYARAVFDALKLEVDWLAEEGEHIEASGSSKQVVAKVRGPCKDILLAERTALNILSRASGVATQTRAALQIKSQNGWHGHVAGTRKTTPGFGRVEKYALQVGGAATHRQDLSQMVMLKDNHIMACGSIASAVEKAKSVAGFSMKIEVETGSLRDAMQAAQAGADIIMLDNMAPIELHKVAATVKERYPNVILEASGGITEATMASFMGPHIDVISRGSLTQGYPCLDFSLKIDPPATK